MDIVVCFALFLAAMLFCLVKDFSLAWALLFALVLFFALGLRRGYGAKALVKMAWSKMPKSMIVLRILFFIGLLTGLWRSCGTIAFFIYHGIRVITPSLFILVAHILLTVLKSEILVGFGRGDDECRVGGQQRGRQGVIARFFKNCGLQPAKGAAFPCR